MRDSCAGWRGSPSFRPLIPTPRRPRPDHPMIHTPIPKMRLTPPQTATETTTAIVDNRARTVGNFLAGHSVPESLLSVVSAYFTIYGYGDLRDQLDRIGRMRFLYGDPRGVGALDPEEAEEKAFRLTDEGNLELTQALRQKPLARACAKWIERKADIRTITQSNFLHGKMYHISKPAGAASVPGETAALLGSSNFTRRGLGTGSNPNLELNLEVRSAADRAPLLDWFDRLWHDAELTHDAKKDVLDALERLGRDYSPEFVYYKTLYHVLGDRLAQQEESEKLAGGVHLFDSQIWNHLYDFQRHGVISAINRLLLHNGCIVADSVGLGKTFTALGVIKYFESRNERVLVLCPSRLKPNWLRFLAYTGQRTNPFIADRFGYTVLAHTDLSRTQGMAGDIDLAQFNWSAFDLIVIDESHNFRNEGREKRDDEGNLVSRSRYRRLLEEVLKEGTRTKVLMLSGTPVNTTLRDLRNQIYLMTEKDEDAFRALGVGSIQSIFARAQKEFQKWEKRFSNEGTRDKAVLLERLGADFLAVLDAVTIARSRHHIRTYYPDFEKEHGAGGQVASGLQLLASDELRSFEGRIPAEWFPLFGISAASPPAAFQCRPELSGIRSLVAPEHRLGILPPAKLAEHLERKVHQVAGELPPERVPAPPRLRLQSCEGLGLLPPLVSGHGAHGPRGVPRRAKHGRVARPCARFARLLQGRDGLVGQRRDVLVARLLVFRPPQHLPALEVDVAPPKLPDGTDSVAGFVREHEGDVEPPPDPPRHPEECPVLVLGEHHPGRVLFRGPLEALERIPFEEQAALLVPRSPGPIQNRDQELEVVLDHPVGHGLSARSDSARAPFADEAVPVPLGQGGRVAVPPEEPEEHVCGGPVVRPRTPPLGGRHLLAVDVKELPQSERLRLGLGLAVQVRANESGREFVRLPLRPHPVPVSERPGKPAPVLAPLNLEVAGLRVREDPDPVPAPFAGAVRAPTSFRACHHSIPLGDGPHDLRERKLAGPGVFR